MFLACVPPTHSPTVPAEGFVNGPTAERAAISAKGPVALIVKEGVRQGRGPPRANISHPRQAARHLA
jgi:hypothetical protein